MSAVLDTILGLAFMFFLVALLCSTAVETWANWVKKRAKFLLRGLGWMVGSSGESTTPSTASAGAVQTGMRASVTRLADLARGGVAVLGKEAALNDAARAASPAPVSDTPDASVDAPTSSGVMAVMGHPLVDALKTRNALGTKTRNPGRIPTPTLATVLLDLYAAGPSSGLNASAREALTKLSELAEGRADRLKPLIEEWIDAQMQQVTEAYKRWTKRWLIVIASVVVLGLGIDTVAVMQALYTSEPLRTAVTSAIGAGTACNPGIRRRRADTGQADDPVCTRSSRRARRRRPSADLVVAAQ